MSNQTDQNSKQDELMRKILSDPSYKGKHIIVVDDKVFTANTGDGDSQILDEVDKKYHDKIPSIAYITDADSLILFL